MFSSSSCARPALIRILLALARATTALCRSDAAFGGLDWRVALVLFLTISDPKHYLDVRLEAAPGLKAVPVLDFNAVARQAVQDDCVGRQAQSMARHTPPCARVRSRRPRQTLVRSLFVTLDAVSSGESPAVPPWALVLGSHRHEHRQLLIAQRKASYYRRYRIAMQGLGTRQRRSRETLPMRGTVISE
jgi:hypothetical protein